MKLNFRNLLIMFLSLLLLGILSGCSRDKKKASKKRQDHYEPTILTSNGDMIRIKYLDVNSNAQPEQALQLIIDHCGNSYIETTRINESGYTTVEAECTHGTNSQ